MTKRVRIKAPFWNEQVLTAYIAGEICDDIGLGDLDVQILPTEESSVIRILQEQPFPM